MSDRLRVILAEDHYLVREGTRRLLEATDQVEVVASVGTADELLREIGRTPVDVVVTDIRMPPGHQMEGITAAHQIRREHHHVGVVVLSQHADDAYAFELFKRGTEGLAYLLKDRIRDVDELLDAMRATGAGGSVVDAKIVEALVSRRVRIAGSPLTQLTPRELEVLREMARGASNATIGERLALSESSVEKYVGAILTKLGLSGDAAVHRRVAAVLTFLEHADTTHT